MKTLLYVAAAFVTVSCTAELLEPAVSPVTGPNSIKVQADLELPSTGKETKSTVSDLGEFLWTNGDALRLYTTEGLWRTSYGTEDGGSANASFTVEMSQGEEISSVAIFPSSVLGDICDADSDGLLDDLTLTLPGEIAWVPGEADNIMLATGFEDGASSLAFKNIGGLIKILLIDVPAGATHVDFSTGKNISGDFTITDFATTENPSITVTDGTNGLTMTFDELAVPTTMAFYVPVPVGTYPSIAFDIKNAAGTSLCQQTAGMSNDVGRNELLIMPPLMCVGGSGALGVDIPADYDGTYELPETGNNVLINLNGTDGSIQLAYAAGAAPAQRPANVYLHVASGTIATLDIQLESSHVELEGTGTISNITTLTDVNSLEVAGSVALGEVTVNGGSLAVSGIVESITVSPDAARSQGDSDQMSISIAPTAIITNKIDIQETNCNLSIEGKVESPEPGTPARVSTVARTTSIAATAKVDALEVKAGATTVEGSVSEITANGTGSDTPTVTIQSGAEVGSVTASGSGASINVESGSTIETVNTSNAGSIKIDGDVTTKAGAGLDISGLSGVTIEPVARIGETDYPTLSAALAAVPSGVQTTITLAKNITLKAPCEIADGMNLVLDLNGKTIFGGNTGNADYTGQGLLRIRRGANLTVDGTTAGSAIKSRGGFYSPIVITVLDDDASKTATLTIQGGNYEGTYAAVAGNGTRHNTQISIDGATLTATDGPAIYQPQEGTLTVSNSTLTGTESAIEIRSGNLTIDSGTFNCTASSFRAVANGNGSTITGAAIAVSQHTTNKPIEVTIQGGTFNGIYSLYEAKLHHTTAAVSLSVTGGTFNGSLYSQHCSGFIEGGNFRDPMAFSYARAGVPLSVTMSADRILDAPIEVNGIATLNLGTHTIRPSNTFTVSGAMDGQLFSSGIVRVKRGGNLTINGNGIITCYDANNTARAYTALALTVAGEAAEASTDAEKARLRINGGMLEGYYYGIAGNGSRHGTQIEVSGGTVKARANGDGTAIYHPQDGTITVSGGTVEGSATGIEIRAGSLSVSSGTVRGNGVPSSVTPNGNGTTTVGAGIAVMQHTTRKHIRVGITGGTIEGYTPFHLSNPQNNSATDLANVEAYLGGGNFSVIHGGINAVGKEGANIDAATLDITGGTYASDPSAYVAPGYEAVRNGSSWTAQARTYAASIGDDRYYTLAEAFAAARTDDTILVLKDLSHCGGLFLGAGSKTLTLDLNGKTVSFNEPAVGSPNTQTQALHLEKGNTVTIKDGTLTLDQGQTAVKMLIQNYCNLTLRDVAVDGRNLPGNARYVLSNNCGIVRIEGSSSITAKSGDRAFDVCWAPRIGYPEGTQVTVNTTGTITGDVEFDLWGANAPGPCLSTLTIESGHFVGNLIIDNRLATAAPTSITIGGGSFQGTGWPN